MLSSNVKYIGLDVHKEAITVAVRSGAGKLVAESIVETKARRLDRSVTHQFLLHLHWSTRLVEPGAVGVAKYQPYNLAVCLAFR